MSYPCDMNDFTMTCRDYKNTLKMEKCSKKTLAVSRTNNGNITKWK